MSSLEVIAVVASLASVIYAARRHVATWPTGIIGVGAYFVVFLQARLYADMLLQVVFFVQSVDGWRDWRRARRGPVAVDGCGMELPGGIPIRRLSGRVRAFGMVAMVLFSLLLGSALARWTNAAAPYLDAAVSTLSLVANGLLARRVLENWMLWVTADALYVGLFLAKGLHLSAGLYVVFFGLAALGWVRWQRECAVIAPASTVDPTVGDRAVLGPI